MYRFWLLLVPAALFAGQARYARMGEMDGKVEVQLQAADPWQAAERNLTLSELTWLRTGSASRVEVELDEGSALRLGPDSLIELSDYTRLSTGQRITVLSLDRGLAYFTGEPQGHDAMALAVPGAQITFLRGARVRIEAADTFSRITVIEGAVRFTCPAAELDIRDGQTVRVEPANTARFSLDRDPLPMELDRWSEDRDKVLAAPTSMSHVAMKYGVADLDTGGEWVATDIGAVWKPKVPEGWAPFQKGRWRWYDTLGYTWVSDDAWGWLPYHYGRWTRKNDMGWVWVPSAKPVFKPGDVYWLYNRQLAGWGPLAPGEEWTPSAAPQQFLNVNTTYAAFAADVRVIDPAGFTARPKEPLGVAAFALALPSPSLPASRLEAVRPTLRVGATKPVEPVVPGTSYQNDVPPPPPPAMPPAVVTNPASDAPPVVQPGPPPDPGLPMPPVVYPVPVYTGIVVINPPEHPDYSRRNGNNNNRSQPPSTTTPPATQTPPVRGNSSGSNKPPQPTITQAPQPVSTSPSTPTQPARRELPRVGAPAPTPTDRPRIESPLPKIERTREQPREAKQPESKESKAETKTDAPRKQ